MPILLKGDSQLAEKEKFRAKNKIKGLIYVRVSSDDQLDNYSLESQIDLCTTYAIEKLFYREDELMVFVEEGEMGDNPDRPALNNMLNSLKKEKIGESVIVYDSDRLARDNFLQRFILNQILEEEASLKIVRDEAFNPFDENSMLQFNIKGVLAEYYKKKLHSETKRGRITKVTKHKKMMGINKIFGYNYDKEEDILVINEEEKEQYLKVVDMLLGQDLSISQIAKELSKQGVPAPKGNVWHQATLSRILKNEAYTGKFYYGKTEVVQIGGKKKQIKVPKEKWIEIPVPAIIDETTYERIQRRISELKKGHSGRPSDTLLRGIGKCGKCGHAVVIGRSSQLKNKRLRYYNCIYKSKRSYEVGTGNIFKRCKSRTYRQDVIDEMVWEYLMEKLKNPEKIIESIVKQQGDVQKAGNLFKKRKDIEKKINEQETIKDRYFDLYAMGRISSKQDLDKKLDPLEEKVQDLKIDLEIIDEQLKYITANHDEMEQLKEKVRKFKEVIQLDNLTIKQKKDIVNKFIKKIVLHDDEIEIHTAWSTHYD
ncbi:recombinase family protein [Priestia endophytica]